MTDAPVAREHLIAAHNLILKLQENPRTSLEQVDGKDLLAQAIADAEARGASRSAPPADEVAGLRAARDASAEVLLAWHGSHVRTRLDAQLTELQRAFDAARLENHLKGKR